MTLQWIVSQIGAREHYIVPCALHRRGHLDRLYTDAWCRFGSSLLRRGPAPLRKFAGRFSSELPSSKVRSFTWTSIGYARRLARHAGSAEHWTRLNLEIGAWFDGAVARDLERRGVDLPNGAFFGFQTGSLQTIELLNRRGFVTVLDQASAARVEEDLVQQEMEKWPGWERKQGQIPESYFERMAAEWEVAALVLVNSEWSKSALVQQGVPAGKIIVVPLAYEVSDSEEEQAGGAATSAGAESRDGEREGARAGLTVIWLGQVILRKGIQYLVEAARQLRGRDIRILVVGPIGITEEAVASAPENVTFLGRVTRDRARALYRQADVFVLPTISDGFAITQIEAMAQGLPVIATPHCGDVVSDAVDGFIVPAAQRAPLAEAIDRLDRDRELLTSMGRHALVKSRQFTAKRYADGLEGAALRALRERAAPDQDRRIESGGPYESESSPQG